MSQHETTVDLGPLENTKVRFEYTAVLIGDKWIDAGVFDGVGWIEMAEAMVSENRISELAQHAAADAQDAWEARQEANEERGYP